MALDNLRDFVRAIDAAGDLVRVARPVAVDREITEIADRCMKSPGGGPALLFERPRLLAGSDSRHPVAVNLFGSERRMGMALGVERLDDIGDRIAELVHLKVDVIVAPNPWAAAAAKSATATIPIVVIVVDDPVQAKLVASLARPGGNVTGLTAAVGASDIIGKQLELLTQSVPNISRVTLLKDPTHPFAASARDEAERAARELRVHLQTLDVRGPEDFERAFALMLKDGTGAIIAPPRMLLPHAQRLATLATKHRLPAIFGFRQPVEAGGFMSYGPDFADLLRRVGIYVDKILRGANPGDLPVEQPTKFELVINMKAARALGLALPTGLLARADQVIE